MAMTCRWSRMIDHTLKAEGGIDRRGHAVVCATHRRATEVVTRVRDGLTAVSTRPAGGDDDRLTPALPEVLRAIEDTLRQPEVDLGSCHIRFTETRGVRCYEDSDGNRFQTESAWTHSWVGGRGGAQGRTLADGTPDVSKVPTMILRLVRDARWRGGLPLTTIDRVPRAVLVLTPSVAAVLWHELVAHVAEELRSGTAPLRIGPDTLTITAEHPRRRGLDDDGDPIGPGVIVHNGIIASGRSGGGHRNGRWLTGLAQAAWHTGPARPRCTHLQVVPTESSATSTANHDTAIVCRSTSGAELFGRYALIDVSTAELAQDGAPVRALRPFRFGVGIRQLARCVESIGDDTSAGRAGLCVKAGQALPTVVRTPTIVLRGVTIHAR